MEAKRSMRNEEKKKEQEDDVSPSSFFGALSI